MKLKELPNTVVNTKTQEEYDELMRIYEEAGWEWIGGGKPTKYNDWNVYREETCIPVKNNIIYANLPYFKGCAIISLSEFKQIQGPGNRKQTKFKVGDKVKILGKSVPGFEGWENYKERYPKENGYHYGYVKEIRGDGSGREASNCIVVSGEQNATGNYFASRDLELIKTPVKGGKTIMQKITTLAKRLLDKKLQKLYRVGYVNDGLSLTEKGKEALLEVLFLEKKDELVKLADEEIKEEKD